MLFFTSFFITYTENFVHRVLLDGSGAQNMLPSWRPNWWNYKLYFYDGTEQSALRPWANFATEASKTILTTEDELDTHCKTVLA